MLPGDNPFWRFSLAVYGHPGVADECLALQRAHQIDVNILLFCMWLGAARNITLSDQDIGAFEKVVRAWHQAAVRPLRAVRDSIKTMPLAPQDDVKALRKDVLAIELRAEQIEQAMLFASVADQGKNNAGTAAAVRTNLRTFLRKSIAGEAGAGHDAAISVLADAASAVAGWTDRNRGP